jgi:hypothetical protein
MYAIASCIAANRLSVAPKSMKSVHKSSQKPDISDNGVFIVKHADLRPRTQCIQRLEGAGDGVAIELIIAGHIQHRFRETGRPRDGLAWGRAISPARIATSALFLGLMASVFIHRCWPNVSAMKKPSTTSSGT